MALSVLPIVQKLDPDAASVIERNMIMVEGVRPVSEGPQAVANAFGTIFDNLGWNCDYVGQAEGIDDCQQVSPSSGSSLNGGASSGIPKYAAFIVMLVFAVLIGMMLFVKFGQIVRRKVLAKEVQRRLSILR